MSRTVKNKILFNDGMFDNMERLTGNRSTAYCSLFHETHFKFWYTQVGYDAKEKMRNANRALNKRTRQYLKKQTNNEVSHYLLHSN